MKITVTVETDDGRLMGTTSTVTNTRYVAVGGPHEWTGAIKRATDELGALATAQLMQAADYDAQRQR